MLFTSSPTPVALKEPAAAEEQQPAITSTPTAMNFDADDEDEALQAVLFASLMEEQAQMEAFFDALEDGQQIVVIKEDTLKRAMSELISSPLKDVTAEKLVESCLRHKTVARSLSDDDGSKPPSYEWVGAL